MKYKYIVIRHDFHSSLDDLLLTLYELGYKFRLSGTVHPKLYRLRYSTARVLYMNISKKILSHTRDLNWLPIHLKGYPNTVYFDSMEKFLKSNLNFIKI